MDPIIDEIRFINTTLQNDVLIYHSCIITTPISTIVIITMRWGLWLLSYRQSRAVEIVEGDSNAVTIRYYPPVNYYV